MPQASSAKTELLPAAAASVAGDSALSSYKRDDFDLDDELLSILTDVPNTTSAGAPLHNKVADVWQQILSEGLPADAKQKLLRSYAVQSNCELLHAPPLNNEAKVMMPKALIKRDELLMQKQRQLGIALAALGQATNLILSKDSSPQAILKPVADACRLLCDSHFEETRARRGFVTNFVLDQTLKNSLMQAKRGALLFGDNMKTILQQSNDGLKRKWYVRTD